MCIRDRIITLPSGSRGKAGTAALIHSSLSIVECYNLDGIPLVEINKLHTAIGSPTLDSYKVAVTSVSTNGITNGGWDVTATQNVQFEQFYPQLQTTVYPETDIIPRLNVVSATSIKDGSNTDEASFINDGVYLDCIANEDNYLTFPKLICSKVNEDAKLAGSKSLTMQLLMSTANENISPVVDTDRCSIITTTNRINEISSTNSNAESNTGDLNDAVYITKVMNLLQPANTLKVQFEAWRHPDTEIHVMYRIQPVGSSLAFSEIGYTYFNGNGKEDKTVQKTEAYLLRDLIYTYNGPEFISTTLADWAAEHTVEREFIQPEKPPQNSYIERFNRTYRDEVLNMCVFETLSEVRAITEEWMDQYNEERPHDALGDLTPFEYRWAHHCLLYTSPSPRD